jgi:hypothetical protein
VLPVAVVVVVVVVADVAVVGDVLGLGLVCAEHKPAIPRVNAAIPTMFSLFILIMFFLLMYVSWPSILPLVKRRSIPVVGAC